MVSVVVDLEKEEALALKCGPSEAGFAVQDRANICTHLEATSSLRLHRLARRRRDRDGAVLCSLDSSSSRASSQPP